MPLYQYTCEDCGASYDEVFKYEEKPATIVCGNCGKDAVYYVGSPAMFRVKYEQNGRIGFKYDMGNGKKTHRSATRENYEHLGGSRSSKDFHSMGADKNRSVLTKRYDEHVKNTEKTKLARANHEAKKILKGD
jgi:putative FmdB family regulatory protein